VFVPGTQKGASTFLFHAITWHPQVRERVAIGGRGVGRFGYWIFETAIAIPARRDPADLLPPPLPPLSRGTQMVQPLRGAHGFKETGRYLPKVALGPQNLNLRLEAFPFIGELDSTGGGLAVNWQGRVVVLEWGEAALVRKCRRRQHSSEGQMERRERGRDCCHVVALVLDERRGSGMLMVEAGRLRWFKKYSNYRGETSPVPRSSPATRVNALGRAIPTHATLYFSIIRDALRREVAASLVPPNPLLSRLVCRFEV